MHYSTNKDDIDYKPWLVSSANNETIIVYLNDDEVGQVITVDTIGGYILKYVEPIVVDEKGELPTEELFGNVSIKFELKEKQQ